MKKLVLLSFMLFMIIQLQAQIATGYYTLTARCSGKVLDVLDASKLDGATIQQWSLNGNIAQHWLIEPVKGAAGYYTLTARCSGKLLDVLDASKKDGAKIQQWKLNGNIAQHWKIEPVAGAAGYYTLTARCSGKLLDVLDASKKDGAKIQQWKLNGNIAQHWKLDKVATSDDTKKDDTKKDDNNSGKKDDNSKKTLDNISKIEMGLPAPNFTMNDVNGKPIALSSLKGKYVLIDFWASWCKPCRAENPNNVAMYNQYKSKGFEILGVSLDNDKASWLKAIKDDNLTWKHVSDLGGWQNAVAKMYGVKSIPFTVLVDKDGKIVAKNLRGATLKAKLQQLFP